MEATSGTGLKSGTASTTVTVDYIDPVAPILSADWMEDQGLTVVAVTNGLGDPGATPPTVDTIANRVERSDDGGDTWVTVAEDVEPDGGLTDWQVPLNTDVQYRAVAISELGAEAIGEPIGATTSSRAVWLRGPAGDMLAIERNVQLQADPRQDVVLEQYYGRTRPAAHYGDARPATVQVSGLLWEGHRQTWRPELLLGGDIYYRDPEGRAFWGSVTAGPQKQTTGTLMASVSLTVEAVDA